jgi:hypothetical protein
VSDEPVRALRQAGIERILSVDPAPRLSEADLSGLQGATLPASLLALLRRPGTARRATDLQLDVPAAGDPFAGPSDPAAQVEAGRERARPLVDAWLSSQQGRPGDAATG